MSAPAAHVVHDSDPAATPHRSDPEGIGLEQISRHDALGPLQVIGVRLPPGSSSVSRVIGEVDRISSRSAVRVLDVVVMSKDREGTLVRTSFDATEGSSVGEDFGELLSRLFPTRTAGAGDDAEGELLGLWAQAELLPAGESIAFLLVEHLWARELFVAVGEEGGAVFSAALLAPTASLVIDAEIAAMDDAARSIAESQAAEAQARLRSAAVRDDVDQTVAAADRIRSVAAARALQALTEAGLIERAAAHEAADALDAAGLIIATVEEIVAEVIVEDSALVAAAEWRAADAAQAASVTPAEIRVLRYLPTPLTFALIADRLGISRAAAKNRAERAYKKLKVHNRAEAVKRARAIRVLP